MQTPLALMVSDSMLADLGDQRSFMGLSMRAAELVLYPTCSDDQSVGSIFRLGSVSTSSIISL